MRMAPLRGLGLVLLLGSLVSALYLPADQLLRSLKFTDDEGNLITVGSLRGCHQMDIWRYSIATRSWTWLYEETAKSLIDPAYSFDRVAFLQTSGRVVRHYSRSSLPFRSGAAVWSNGTYGYMYGGFDADGSGLRDLWRLDFETLHWKLINFESPAFVLDYSFQDGTWVDGERLYMYSATNVYMFSLNTRKWSTALGPDYVKHPMSFQTTGSGTTSEYIGGGLALSLVDKTDVHPLSEKPDMPPFSGVIQPTVPGPVETNAPIMLQPNPKLVGSASPTATPEGVIFNAEGCPFPDDRYDRCPCYDAGRPTLLQEPSWQTEDAIYFSGGRTISSKLYDGSMWKLDKRTLAFSLELASPACDKEHVVFHIGFSFAPCINASRTFPGAHFNAIGIPDLSNKDEVFLHIPTSLRMCETGQYQLSSVYKYNMVTRKYTWLASGEFGRPCSTPPCNKAKLFHTVSDFTWIAGNETFILTPEVSIWRASNSSVGFQIVTGSTAMHFDRSSAVSLVQQCTLRDTCGLSSLPFHCDSKLGICACDHVQCKAQFNGSGLCAGDMTCVNSTPGGGYCLDDSYCHGNVCDLTTNTCSCLSWFTGPWCNAIVLYVIPFQPLTDSWVLEAVLFSLTLAFSISLLLQYHLCSRATRPLILSVWSLAIASAMRVAYSAYCLSIGQSIYLDAVFSSSDWAAQDSRVLAIHMLRYIFQPFVIAAYLLIALLWFQVSRSSKPAKGKIYATLVVWAITTLVLLVGAVVAAVFASISDNLETRTMWRQSFLFVTIGLYAILALFLLGAGLWLLGIISRTERLSIGSKSAHSSLSHKAIAILLVISVICFSVSGGMSAKLVKMEFGRATIAVIITPIVNFIAVLALLMTFFFLGRPTEGKPSSTTISATPRYSDRDSQSSPQSSNTILPGVIKAQGSLSADLQGKCATCLVRPASKHCQDCETKLCVAASCYALHSCQMDPGSNGSSSR